MRIPPNGPSRLRKIRSDAMQLLNDTRSYNNNCGDSIPFDLGPELVIVQLCDHGLKAAENADAEEYSRVANALSEFAERVAAS